MDINVFRKENITLSEWREAIKTLKQRVEKLERRYTLQAQKLCKEAGLDPNLLGIHPHNAMVSYEEGKPWKNIDYKKVKKCLYILNVLRWRPYNLYRSLSEKLYKKINR